MAPSRLDRASRQLDWNLLRTFMVIVQEGGITRAANHLMLKQPTVSNALKRLERQLGRRLIERGRGGFRVTGAGGRLYRECIEIYGSIARLPVLLDGDDDPGGHIVMAMATHVTCPLLDEALAAFHRRYLRATYEIEITSSATAFRAVQQKTASLAIGLVHERHAGLDYRLLYREHFGFFCGPRHRLFGRRDLSLRDLRDESFVSFKTDHLGDALRPVALLRLREGLEDRIVATSSHLEEVRRLILAGIGIGPLPIHVVERDLRDRLLWRLPPYQSPPHIDIFLATNPRSHLNPAERRFIALLGERIAATPLGERTYPAAMAVTPTPGTTPAG